MMPHFGPAVFNTTENNLFPGNLQTPKAHFHVFLNDSGVDEMSRSSQSGVLRNHVQNQTVVVWVAAPCSLVDDGGSKHF
jgi:hypothetical protein